MLIRLLAIIGVLCLLGTPAHASSMSDCSAKYKAAKDAGTLNGQSWSQFRKSQCGSADNTSASTSTAQPASAPAAAPAAAPASPATKASAKPTAAPAPAGSAVFPTAVSAKYSKESEGQARMHTCLDQYNANKASNANGGLKWIQSGGGYYSQCNKKLKG